MSKVRTTHNVDDALLAEARAAVAFLQYHEHDQSVTLTSLMSAGLEKEIKRLRRKYNDGEPFKPGPRPRSGRPRQ